MGVEIEEKPLLGYPDYSETYGSTSDYSVPSDYSAAPMGNSAGAGSPPAKVTTVGGFRQVLPQVLATTAKSLLYLCMGMMLAFPSLVIRSLTSPDWDESGLHFSADLSSWYGSLLYIFQPLGSLTSGALLQTVGCKRLMILINIPMLIGWLLPYFATSNMALFCASALNGFVIGLMEAPTVRYISEMCQPSLRGVLTTYSAVFTSAGYFVTYSLAEVTDWKHVALISASAPIVTMLALSLVPETPIWLMSKGRPEDALKSLRWLRGWTSAEMVKDEHKKLEFYSRKPSTSSGSEKGVDGKDHASAQTTSKMDTKRNTVDASATDGKNKKTGSVEENQRRGLKEAWRDLTSRETLIPLIKCNILFALSVFSMQLPLKPYQLNIFGEMNLPVEAAKLSAVISLVAIGGIISCMFLINWTGKKPLGIASFAIVSVCFFLLGLFLMKDQDSLLYDWWLRRWIVMESPDQRWLPVALLILNSFANNLGLQGVIWTYLSEILPYRGRGIATGIVTSVYYMVIFAGVKTFPKAEDIIGLDGIFFVYGAFSLVGAFFIYFFLPETDGRFLSDIEIEIVQGNGNGAAREKSKAFV